MASTSKDPVHPTVTICKCMNDHYYKYEYTVQPLGGLLEDQGAKNLHLDAVRQLWKANL